MQLDFRQPPSLQRGLAIGPLFPVAATWLWVAWHLLDRPVDLVKSLILVTLIVVPISYAVMLLVGGPVVFALRRYGAITPLRCLLAGPLLGFLLGIPLARFFGDSGFMLLMAVLGLIASAGFTCGAWMRGREGSRSR